MALKRKFTKTDIRKGLKSYQTRIETSLVLVLQKVGEDFINDARTSGSYNDQTGNLRSSVGYLILKNGRVISSAFPQAGNGTDQKSGANEGQRYARKLAREFGGQGYAFIGVAGMEYATIVESRGREVISGSSQRAKENVEKWLRYIRSKFSQ